MALQNEFDELKKLTADAASDWEQLRSGRAARDPVSMAEPRC